MAFIGSTTSYPTVTPAAADLVTITQASTGEVKTATVAGLTGTASEPVVALNGTSHPILSSYRSKLVTFSNAAAVAASLAQAGVSFPDGWFTDVKNLGAGTVTITPTTSTIDGAASLALTTGQSCRIVSDGTNYRTIFTAAIVAVDADDVTYTPTTLADWDGSADPGDVERVTDLESAGAGDEHYEVDGTPASDDTWAGRSITGVNAGATIAQWEAVYMGSGGEWLLADANGSGTYPCRGLAAAAGTDNNPMIVVTEGVIRNDAWTWTPGGSIYLSATPGGLTQTAPSTAGDKVQPVGFAITADVMYLCIGAATYIEVA
jgi:hypothetical protein